jgi:phage shock protein A
MFDRFATMVRSNLNDLISRAENPEKMLNQLIVDMRTQLDKARQQVAQAIADEKKLEADSLAQKKQAEDWERRAMLAVQEGRDDLAKQALMRYNEALQGAQQLHETWVKSKTETESLKASLRQLNDKIEEAKRKKNILIARKKRAEAQQQIANTMQGLGDTSAFDTFDRMAERIQLMEAEAEAGAELAGEISGDTLESKFLQLEQGGASGGEDEALNDLKAKMGLLEAPKGDAAKQLGAGAAAAKEDGAHAAKDSTGPITPSLTPEDLKELEDLDLSELDKEAKKA